MEAAQIPALHCMHRESFQIVHVQQEQEIPQWGSLDFPATSSRGQGNKTTKLYDREEEQQLLQECYRKCRQRARKHSGEVQAEPVDEVDLDPAHTDSLDALHSTEKSNKLKCASLVDSNCNEHQELVLITGNSGMGKTALARSIKDQVLSDGGFFVSGKCGHTGTRAPQDQRQPFAPFVTALSEWVDQVNQRPAIKQKLRGRVQQDQDILAAIGVLVEEVPALESLLGTNFPLLLRSNSGISITDDGDEEESPTKSPMKEGHVRTQFSVVFQRFLRIVCRLGHPVVLLLDDLQWAKESSVDLLGSLLLSSLEGILIIGTCRPEEVSVYDPLSQLLRRVEEKGRRIVEIIPSKLQLESLVSMIEEISELPLDECQVTALNVLHETDGNALFAQQFIQSILQSDFHDADSQSSFSSMSDAQDQSSDDRIVRWLWQEMRRMPQECQFLLQVISCLGGTFTMKVLQRTSLHTEDVLQGFLSIALKRQLIVYNQETESGKFAHDKYQEAAYSLLIASPQERSQFHLDLGRNLLEECGTKEELDQHLGTIVDLLLVGRDFLTSETERANLALWCMHVGRRVATTSSFAGPWAIGYMEQGIQLLGPRHWRDQYELSLSLYNAAAELAYCQGNHGRVNDLVSAIKENSRTFMDSVQAFITSMYSLAARADQQNALEVGFYVLEQLGYPFPRKLSWLTIQMELCKTKRLLQKNPAQVISNLPLAEDKPAKIAMRVITMMHPIFATLRPQYTVLTGTRIVQITLQRGLSPCSPLGFALYSMTLTRMWHLEDARQYSQFALKLGDTHVGPEWKGKFLFGLAAGPALLSKSSDETYELMYKTHLACLESGDTEIGLRASMSMTMVRLYFGHPLQVTLSTAQECSNLCEDYSSIITSQLVGTIARVCNILVGKEFIANDFIDSLCADVKNDVILLYNLFVLSVAALYMNKLSLGSRIMVEMHKRKKTASQLLPFCQMNQSFCEGLFAAALGRNEKKKLRYARKQLLKLKQLAKHNPQIFSGKVCLLEAEIANASRKDTALPLYMSAIQLSERNGFIHEQALACEKVGRMLSDRNCSTEAENYFHQARVLYGQWGATAKVKEIDELFIRQ